MPDSSSAPGAEAASRGAEQPQDFLPGARRDRAAEAPAPWVALSKAECVFWAIALHRAAVAARLSGGKDE